MHRRARWPGDWAAICDSCGERYPASELRKRWDGLMVCSDDWEPRHPQDLLRVLPERIVPPWTRPEPPDVFIPLCDLWGIYAYSGLATSGCAQSGKVSPLSFAFLLNLKADAQRPN